MSPKWGAFLERGNRIAGFESSNDNQRENKQFRDATRGLSADLKRRMHENVSGLNYTYSELQKYAKELLRETK